MTSIRILGLVGALCLLTAGAVSAKPCVVGTTTDSSGQKNSNDISSKVDGDTTAKVSPGAKSESPGTVGAMNNVGANTQPSADEAKPAEGKVVKPGSDDC